MIIIMNNKFDVIVIGCGPAGAQAAKKISKNGPSFWLIILLLYFNYKKKKNGEIVHTPTKKRRYLF